jgi:hypothetical protein
MGRAQGADIALLSEMLPVVERHILDGMDEEGD